ncbi:GDSL-type esterase/lipase family protein [Bifidobacterium tissieri]|uniref:GDSL family lipase n=1 Tax=Bifidobacterium tissieri TaxID=1630162 RepID=A0A5M9ZTK9_9BIFI|nr:GDSL-type esterase/lipase family protein [Bifidobacterium tissieri]KAA8827582.1 GDSL family lipase [Bifidobacterium tissieri]KAA8830976.1 GDSL family lipase [Bifidobacterium tissieri]
MKNLLCFGDSNTFGTNPAQPGTRHPFGVRWTGRLATMLSPEWRVIEEGMGGRTTVFDNPLEPQRAGIQALPIVLQSHRPLDCAIVSLGTNDLKEIFHASPRTIAAAAEQVCAAIRDYPYGGCGPAPKILLVSPIAVKPGISRSPYVGFDEDTVERSHRLAPFYREVAERNDWMFLDAATVAEASDVDKLHMDPENHAHLADAIADILRIEFTA